MIELQRSPEIHMICGRCGCNHMWEYEISDDIDDDTDEEIQVVYLSCRNCSTLSSLDEYAKERKR